MNKKILKQKIIDALNNGLGINKNAARNLISKNLTPGKAYEAYILGVICNRLRSKEGYILKLVGGTKIALKSSPGPINKNYPYIQVHKKNKHIADIWTDIEFTAMSAQHKTSYVSLGDYHELDIAMVIPNTTARPHHNEILLAAECKNTGYQKHLLREILGVRRELSLLKDPIKTFFSTWPATDVPADPPSCLMVYSTDPLIKNYDSPGNFFGINFIHEPI